MAARARGAETSEAVADGVVIVVVRDTIVGGGKQYGVGDKITVKPAEADRLCGKGVAARVAQESAEAGEEPSS